MPLDQARRSDMTWRSASTAAPRPIRFRDGLVRSYRQQKPRLVHAALIIGALIVMILSLPAETASQPASKLGTVRSWGYQLQLVDPAAIAASDYDLVVIDYSRDGSEQQAFDRAEIGAMQRKGSGGRRLVLAYLSIGEAEDYRFYWQPSWSAEAPGWLGPENPDWEGNYAVRYWDEDWQRLMFGAPGAYLDRIIEAGFDGVYLDRIDAFEVRDGGLNKAGRMAAMSGFVKALADHARARAPGFIVVGQNGEELLADPVYSAAIDGLGKEDLFYGIEEDGVANDRSDVRASLRLIEDFQRTGKPMLLVEYLSDRGQIAEVREAAAELGAPLFIGARELDDVRSR
jgi:cysteinyl-tRNA synthetase, unknown class